MFYLEFEAGIVKSDGGLYDTWAVFPLRTLTDRLEGGSGAAIYS
jgi:hypothetical protein